MLSTEMDNVFRPRTAYFFMCESRILNVILNAIVYRYFFLGTVVNIFLSRENAVD